MNELSNDLKPKRVNQIRKAYNNAYDLQLEMIAVCKKIQVSYLLSENEIVIPHLVEEYGTLAEMVKLLEKEFKRLKQFAEIITCCTTNDRCVKTENSF